MSDTLRRAIAAAIYEWRTRIYEDDAVFIKRDPDPWDDELAEVVLAVVLADPTVRRWKAAEETAAYYISQYPTVQLAEEREWDPALDALAKAVTPTAEPT